MLYSRLLYHCLLESILIVAIQKHTSIYLLQNYNFFLSSDLNLRINKRIRFDGYVHVQGSENG